MNRKEIKKIFFKLDPELRRFVLKSNDRDIKSLTEQENLLLPVAIEKEFLYKEKDKIKQTKKVIDYRKSYIVNVSLKNKENEYKSGQITKDEYLFHLDTLMERIQSMKAEADSIEERLENCAHEFVPVEAYLEIDILHQHHYNWLSKCKYCNKKNIIETLDEKAPKGFENIPLQNRILYD